MKISEVMKYRETLKGAEKGPKKTGDDPNRIGGATSKCCQLKHFLSTRTIASIDGVCRTSRFKLTRRIEESQLN